MLDALTHTKWRMTFFSHASSPDYAGIRRYLVDGLIVVFIVIASYAATPLKEIHDVERLAWIAADLAVVLYFLSQPSEILRQLREHLLLASWPLLACLSAIWSLTPGISIYHGLQLFMTILMGFFLSACAGLERLLQLLFMSLLVSAILSLLYIALGRQGIGIFGEWIGVFPHKNVLGHMMVLLIFTGLCLLLHGWRPYLTLFGVLFAFALLLLSKSGVAAVAVVVTLAPIPVACLYRWGNALLVAFGAGLMLMVSATGALFVDSYGLDVFELALDALGKDATLTGRSILWEFGIEAYNSRPVLGFGYKAWWESIETAAALLRVVIGQSLWYFHNNFIDVAVAFGTLGPVLLGSTLLVELVAALRAFAVDPQFTKLWSPILIIFVTLLAFVENPLFQNHSIHQVLLVVAVAGGLRAVRSRPLLRPQDAHDSGTRRRIEAG
jgi:exopolysaccharide production protein ExoQ